jgi:hypothetical protein
MGFMRISNLAPKSVSGISHFTPTFFHALVVDLVGRRRVKRKRGKLQSSKYKTTKQAIYKFLL